MKYQAKKSLGQNFLIDPYIINKIINEINPHPEDYIIEIGPGHGALSEPLITSGCNFAAIEKDDELFAKLQQKYNRDNIKLFNNDALNIDFKTIFSERKFKIIGNLPYNIASAIVIKLLLDNSNISEMIFMTQLEVANRIVATPNSKSYGRLSVICQYHSSAELMFTVPKEAFQPIPKVTSAIIKLSPKEPEIKVQQIDTLEEIVAAAFNQRRKTIRNSLKKFLTEEELLKLKILPQSRAENLSINDFVKISNYLNKK